MRVCGLWRCVAQDSERKASTLQTELCRWNALSRGLEVGLLNKIAQADNAMHDLQHIEEVLELYHNTHGLDELLVSASKLHKRYRR